jgi:hypothetical protein
MKRILMKCPNLQEVLDCASPLALLDEVRAATKAVEDHRTPGRWRVGGGNSPGGLSCSS